MNKIHVVHIIPTLGIGGAERFVVDLANNLDREKFTVSIIVLKNILSLQGQLKSDVKVYLVEKKGQLSLGLFFDLENKLRELKPDLVHTHLFGGDLWGRIAARKLYLPVVTTEHNLNYQENFCKHFIKKILRNYSDIYTSPSEAVAEYLQNTYQVTEKKIKIIRHGIELNKFLELAQIKLVSPFRLLMLGRLTKQKGHSVVFQVLAGLQDYDWRLAVVGSGEEKNNLEKLARELKIFERIDFQEAVPDILPILENSDILLMPSLWEGLGITIMEALAAGRLVVASAVGGISEILEDNRTGYLLPVGEVEAWQNKLKSIFDHPDEMQEIVEAGKNHACDNFSLSEMVRSYEDVYTNLL